MKIQCQKEYKRRLKKVLKSKLNGKSKMHSINTWAVAVMRYGAGIIKWRDNGLQTLDRKARKILTMFEAFHPRVRLTGCT